MQKLNLLFWAFNHIWTAFHKLLLDRISTVSEDICHPTQHASNRHCQWNSLLDRLVLVFEAWNQIDRQNQVHLHSNSNALETFCEQMSKWLMCPHITHIILLDMFKHVVVFDSKRYANPLAKSKHRCKKTTYVTGLLKWLKWWSWNKKTVHAMQPGAELLM